MEGKASGFHIFKRVVTPTISSGGKSSDNSAGEDNNNNGGGSVCMVREQDRYMPIANVIRIMRRILPSHAKISDDAKETIQECVSEYISFITSEANERCQREQRKTITAEDVLWAMGKLGFEEYVGPLSHFLNRYRDFEGDRSSVRGDPLVKRSIEMAHIVSAAGYGPAGPSFHIAPHQGMLTPPIASAGPPGYFRDAGNGNSGQTSVACYDPYAQYR